MQPAELRTAPDVVACHDVEAAVRAWESILPDGGTDLGAVAVAFRCWTKHFAAQGQAPLLQLQGGGTVAALLPVQRAKRRMAGVPLRVLASPGNYCWQFGTPIVAAGHADATIGALLAALLRTGGWDVLELGPMLATSPVADALARHGARLGMTPAELHRHEDPLVAIRGNWPDYLAALSTKLRQAIRFGERDLAKAGTVTFEEFRGGLKLDDRLDEFYAVEGGGWKGREGTAIANDATVRAFYTEAAQAAAATGAFRLYLLRLDGRCIAAEYCIVHGSTVHLLKPGYDESWSKHSPGNVLRARILAQLFATRDAERYDLMTGGGEHSAYKARWADERREYVVLRLFNPGSVRGRLARGMRAARSMLERVRARRKQS